MCTGGLLQDPRLRGAVQQPVPAPQDGLVLGQASRNPIRNDGPPRRRVDLVDGRGCGFHGHGVQATL